MQRKRLRAALAVSWSAMFALFRYQVEARANPVTDPVRPTAVALAADGASLLAAATALLSEKE